MIQAVPLQAEAAATRMMIAADEAATEDLATPAAIPAEMAPAGTVTPLTGTALLPTEADLPQEGVVLLQEGVVLLQAGVPPLTDGLLPMKGTAAAAVVRATVLPAGAAQAILEEAPDRAVTLAAVPATAVPMQEAEIHLHQKATVLLPEVTVLHQEAVAPLHVGEALPRGATAHQEEVPVPGPMHPGARAQLQVAAKNPATPPTEARPAPAEFSHPIQFKGNENSH